MVGELFEHVGAGFDLALLELGRDFDPLGFLAGAIFERALQRQIDEAADLFAVPDRNLAGDQRRHAHRLKRREKVADAAVRLVDAVDENQVGMPSSSSARRAGAASGARAGSGSTTTIAMSATASARDPSAAKPIDPGASRMANWSPR